MSWQAHTGEESCFRGVSLGLEKLTRVRRSVTRVFFGEHHIVILHPKGEIFIRAHGPGFRELLGSNNRPY